MKLLNAEQIDFVKSLSLLALLDLQEHFDLFAHLLKVPVKQLDLARGVQLS